MANAQIAAHGVVCNQDTTEFDNLPIGSLIRAAKLYRDLAWQFGDEADRPVNSSEPASTYFDDASTAFARKCEDAYAALERRRPNNENESDAKARALIEWYSSTGDCPQKVLAAVGCLIGAGQPVQ